MQYLTPEFREKVLEISALSKKINKNNRAKLLELIRAHAEEIELLCNRGDKHWAVEDADLIILCLELMLEGGVDIDKVFDECLPRFDKKLGKLAKGAK